MTRLSTMQVALLLVLVTVAGLGSGIPLAAQESCDHPAGPLWHVYDRAGWQGVTTADVAACASELTSASALVSAIEHVRDPRIVRMLIDAGADVHQDGNPIRIDMLGNAIERTLITQVSYWASLGCSSMPTWIFPETSTCTKR